MFSDDGPPWSDLAYENAEVFVAQTSNPGWVLDIDGVSAPHREVMSWARAYQSSKDAVMVLSYSSPWWRITVQIIGGLIPVFLVAFYWRSRIGRISRMSRI